MSYDLDFKIKVIAYYREEHSSGATGEKFGLDDKMISKWVQQCFIKALV
ncbi:helix-turn-helix domain-containing protein [Psychrobacter sp.]|nr:helix-turn-helix domain-containing protein [Psychrobacter sp.]